MNKLNIKYSALALVFATIVSAQAQQIEKNIIEQDHETSLQQWNKSSNAAGVLLDKPSQNSNFEAGYSTISGNFTKPQIGDQLNSIFLNTKGNLYLKNYYLQGHFSYKRNNIKDAKYNASLINPLRDMPYIIADTNSSDWVNQHYDLGFKFSTQPLANKWIIGLTTNYKAYSGAKQRDIRALNKYYELEIDPALVYNIAPKHYIGANFHYKNFKEESSNKNVNTYIDQKYFLLNGLGNAINHIGSGTTMDYQGDEIGTGLQYQFQGSSKLLVAANYTVKAEDANTSFTNARPIGTILNKKWNGQIDFQKSNDNFTHHAQGNFISSKSNGIEYITQFISGLESNGYYVLYKGTRSKYNYKQAQFQYDLIKNKDLAYNWKTSVFGTYSHLENTYLIPKSVLLAENINYGVGFAKLFDLSEIKKSRLTVEAKVALNQNLNGKYDYNGSDANEVTVTDLETRNFQYLTADFTSIEIPVSYSQKLKENSNTEFFIKANAQYITSDQFNFNYRKGFRISVGATF